VEMAPVVRTTPAARYTRRELRIGLPPWFNLTVAPLFALPT
jgi:hypothetical protein